MEADDTRVLRSLPAPLCVITDRHRATHTLMDVTKAAVDGGARWIRVREPDLDLSAYVTLCQLLMDAVADARVTWTVRPSAYLLIRSAWPEVRVGVHLTSADAPWRATDTEILIGRSVHVHDEAAHEENVDYQLLAPVFHTACKADAAPAGTDALTRLASRASIPVVALGGVTPLNAATCMQAGASAIAVCGGVMESNKPHEAVAAYLHALEQQ